MSDSIKKDAICLIAVAFVLYFAITVNADVTLI